MSKGNADNHVEVEDADAAFRKAEEFARRVLTVPKKKIDAKPSKEKTKRKRK